jgi:hypothetical protein
MNAKPPTNAAKLWHQPPAEADQPVAGYDDWLKVELASGLTDVQAGRVTALDKVRKEFGVE